MDLRERTAIYTPVSLLQPSKTSVLQPISLHGTPFTHAAISHRSSIKTTFFLYISDNCLIMSLSSVVFPKPGGDIIIVCFNPSFKSSSIILSAQPSICLAILIHMNVTCKKFFTLPFSHITCPPSPILCPPLIVRNPFAIQDSYA